MKKLLALLIISACLADSKIVNAQTADENEVTAAVETLRKAILDADKEGFLRNQRSLVQTIGRAARNENGRVIMYADTITESMRLAIDETNRRRKIQTDYNLANGITPTTIVRSMESSLGQIKATRKYYMEQEEASLAADPVVAYLTTDQLQKMVDRTRKAMDKAAKDLEFMEAAKLRDEYLALQKLIAEKK